MNTIKKNVIIAVFCELEETIVHRTDSYGYHQAEHGFIVPNTINHAKHQLDESYDVWNVLDLRFAYDWNWLMIAVERIEEEFDVNIDGHVCEIYCPHGSIDTVSEIADSKIESVYKAVVEFITLNK
jgi:hypothetical protein